MSHVVEGLSNEREYRFRLRAVGADGPGAQAPDAHPWFVSAMPEAPGAPFAPGKPEVVPGDGGSTITAWEVLWERNGSWGQWNAIPGSGPEIRTETETGLVKRRRQGPTKWRRAAR